MANRIMHMLVLAFAFSSWTSNAQSGNLSMPPAFTPTAPVEQTLRAYPLGVITKQAAFSHHGKAHRELKLPNGLTGWAYDVGGLPKAVTYGSPVGKQQAVTETEMRHQARSYTLVFDNRGVVVDVLYNEKGPHDGLTALSQQHMKGAVRMEEHTQPGPGGAGR